MNAPVTLTISAIRDADSWYSWFVLDRRVVALTVHLGRRPADDEPIRLSDWLAVMPHVEEILWLSWACPEIAKVAQKVSRAAADRIVRQQQCPRGMRVEPWFLHAARAGYVAARDARDEFTADIEASLLRFAYANDAAECANQQADLEQLLREMGVIQ